MPRIDNCGKNVADYCEKTGEGSSTFDVCNECASELHHFPHAFDEFLPPYNGDPLGDEGYFAGCEHPPYDECDYTCEICEAKLTAEDD